MIHRNVEYFEIAFTTRAAANIVIVSTTSGRNPIISGSFSLSENGGCGPFEMIFVRDAVPTIAVGSMIDFKVKLEDVAKTTYWSGYVTEIPNANTQSTVVRVGGHGLWKQVVNSLIVKFYAADDTDEIVKDILADINANIDVSSSTSEIVIASPVAIGDFEPQFTPASDAIALLAMIQQSTQYGVDQNRKLYFKDLDTTVNEDAHFHVGQKGSMGIAEYNLGDDSNELFNRVYIAANKLVGGGNLILARDDSSSQSTHGLKSKFIQAPALQDPTDIWAFADAQLNVGTTAKTIGNVRAGLFRHFLFPRGKARTHLGGGLYHDLKIAAVEYVFDGQNGLAGSAILGDPDIDVTSEIKKMTRGADFARNASISNTKIEHTRGVEFEQAALADAMQNSKFNVWTTSFADMKSIDENSSFHIHHDKTRQYIGCGYDFERAEYVFDVIADTGQVPATCRVHYDVDKYGRINFAHDADLTDFFYDTQPSTLSWFIDTVNPRAYQNQYIGPGQGNLEYNSVGQWFWQSGTAPAYYKFRVKKVDPQGESGNYYHMIIWNYLDSSNYNYIRMKTDNAPGYNRYRMYKLVSSVNTQIGGELLALRDSDNEIEVRAINAPTNTVMEVYTGGVSDGTISGAMPCQATRKVGLDHWGEGAVHSPQYWAKMDWWEWRQLGSMLFAQIWVSRDGGSTWTAVPISQGVSHKPITFSSGSGTHLKLKVRLNHPGRLYGLGVSWANI